MKYLDGPNCAESQFCRADFYYEFAKALDECGGRSGPECIERYQNMKFSDVVEILAQNGLRMKYFPKESIENY